MSQECETSPIWVGEDLALVSCSLDQHPWLNSIAGRLQYEPLISMLIAQHTDSHLMHEAVINRLQDPIWYSVPGLFLHKFPKS